MAGRLRAILDRGGRVVVIDPRRTETAEVADEHVAIRPGADALLLAAMLHVIFAEGSARLGRFASRVTHVDALGALVLDFPPERVARRTGVAPEITRRLAGEFARAARAACYGRVGLCTQRHGTLATWLVQALNLVTGNLDEVGGMMLTTPAVDGVAVLSRLGLRGTFDRWRSRGRQLPEVAGELPPTHGVGATRLGDRGRTRWASPRSASVPKARLAGRPSYAARTDCRRPAAPRATRLDARGSLARLARFAELDDQVEACRRIFASDTRWTVVRGSDLEEGPSQGLPVWGRHVGDPILASNLTRRVDFALFMVAALENDDLVHEAPAIVGCRTPSALAHAAGR